MYSERIQKLIDLFAKFPTVGPRTASRFVFYLLGVPKEKVEELIKTIKEVKEKIKICEFCFNPFEGDSELCSICSDGRRDKSLVCIVEKEADLEVIEKTKIFKGLYFILGGTILSLKTEKNKEMIEERLEKLIGIIRNPSVNSGQVKEIIIALNSTTEGENTTLWLERKLNNLGPKLTRLARGLPKGGELEYADDETLSSALESRK